MEKRTLATAGLLVIKDNKLLLAYSSKNKQAWYLPGGKVDAGEDTLTALQREIQEELNVVLDPDKLTYYCHVTAPAFGENANIIMEQDCFLYELNEDIRPSNEIEEIKYFDYSMYTAEEKQVIGVIQVMEKLAEDRILV
ncbi:NUDIX hydrolase [Sphingobacterium sp. SGL-16]|uniref:NUDIX hydrolase n=1 Tax=Sphingobacterium sp. SGL-16 TaxID=2710883 RepID=UPI0013ECC78E|nr:NUDIX domain-containing protein [Sphingobacterium sp. SGL-16]NGM72222.1 NUDIX domain-containing protein [Sphingobacterium sp. SGL-16]